MPTLASEEPLFGEILALVDSQLPLGFDATSLACVFALYEWGKLKERAFRAECTRVFASAYRVIIRLNNGTAIAIITTPKAIRIIRSVEMSPTPAPSTITFLIASAAYVNGRNFAMSCMYQGICCSGNITPLRNIIGNISVIIIICAVS